MLAKQRQGSPMIDYVRAFALKDNPFGPRRNLPGVQNQFAMANLETRPLRVHEEPALMNLFVGKAGPFDDHAKAFLSWLEQEGYDRQKKYFGLGTSVFLIGGHQGTGKTTLANVFIKHLKECDNEDKKWRVFDNGPPGDRKAPNDQIEAIQAFKDKIIAETQPNDYCCVVVDDVSSDSVDSALKIYEELLDKKRFILLFLVTSDEKLVNKDWVNSRIPVSVYPTRPMRPSEGVTFVCHRIDTFRIDIKFFEKLKIFPFDEKDIQTALETVLVDNQGLVTIRQLNKTLFTILRDRLKKAEPNFDISKIPNQDRKNYLISLEKEYQRLVA